MTAGDDRISSAAALGLSRRSFLRAAVLSGAGALLAQQSAFAGLFTFFEPLDPGNPLAGYPNRGWERSYRDLYEVDSKFTFLCAPNDTHNCLLEAHVKNGVVVRIHPTFGFGDARDLHGNQASHRWDPRCCQKGLALVRRFYGDRRCKYPMVRAGFLTWARAGYPRDPETGRAPAEYFDRGRDSWTRVTWDEAFKLSAETLADIARTYSGERGLAFLHRQGYDPAMVEATRGAGVQTLKLRGGMAALGATRVFAMNRLANSLALLDQKVRGVDRDHAHGARVWDSYSWHTDLPPGHPMVIGHQTLDWDLVAVENARTIVAWGMNWICTKMPDSHWLTEARIKGTRVVVIAAEYSATSSKADDVLIVRPGTTPALALGFCHVLLKEKRYDADDLRRRSDLPFLVRMDTLGLLRASEIWPDEPLATLENYLRVLKPGEKAKATHQQDTPFVSQELREKWGDFVVWDEATAKPARLSRDDCGMRFDATGIRAALEGRFTVRLADGKTVEVQPVFELVRRYVFENFDPETVEQITWAPKRAVVTLARHFARQPGTTLFAMGMGPNQFFNNDLKDRAVFLLATLTGNIGKVGGNVGSYAGNYRGAIFSGMPLYVSEDPFDIERDPAASPRIRSYAKYESAHYFNSGDRVLRSGKTLLTGESHLPTPTKAIMVSNGNSLIGNAKGHYDNVVNVYPKVEFITVADWWWTGSCEYADIVYPVDSWAEFKFPDMTISVTNPFLYVYPRTPLPRIFNTRSDIEVTAGIGAALAKLMSDERFAHYWEFVANGGALPYLQRILDGSHSTRGYRIEDLEEQAKRGVPAIVMSRTYPKVGGWEQANEDRPWYTKSGRLEFYREEPEFVASGENLPVYREPIDSTFYEPNVIVAKPDPAIRPRTPRDYGVDPSDLSCDARQTRHVVKPWSEVARTRHPLMDKGFRFIYHTPKYRHGAHTTPVDTDIIAAWFGPFGDPYRHDPRSPYVGEAYVDINPVDAKELGVEDGDYVWIDADPSDRPYRGWKPDDPAYRVARLMLRARYYNGTPRGVARTWYNMYGASFGSVKGQATRADGLAKSPETGYQAMFRFGSHQSCTRAWLKPTLMTETLARKDLIGQRIGEGFAADVHCTTGAPREAFVRITRAEAGSPDGQLWRPTRLGLRPTYENPKMARFLRGAFARAT